MHRRLSLGEATTSFDMMTCRPMCLFYKIEKGANLRGTI